MTPERAEFWRVARAFLDPDPNVGSGHDLVRHMRTMPEFRLWRALDLYARVIDAACRGARIVPPGFPP